MKRFEAAYRPELADGDVVFTDRRSSDRHTTSRALMYLLRTTAEGNPAGPLFLANNMAY